MTLDFRQALHFPQGLCGRARATVVVSAVLLLAHPATAQTNETQPSNVTDAAVRTAARELATQGAEDFERGDYPAAYESLSRAFELHPAPSIRIMQARCLVKLGRLVEGLDMYEETRRMPLTEDAPEAYRAAVREAADEGEALRLRIPRLAIQVRRNGRVPEGIEVLLDGRVLPRALLDVDCPVDRGAHVITVREVGRRPVTRQVKANESERLVLDITLDGASDLPALQFQPARVSEAVRPWEATTRWWWGAGAIGGGAAALVGSIVSGVVALDRKSDLDRVCDPGCPPGNQGMIDDFRTYRTAAYVTGGLSAALVGLGSYLLVTDRATGSAAVGLSTSGVAIAGTF